MAQVRRVRRIIRKIDSWTVFKVSSVFWLVVGLAMVLGSVMFWSIVDASGIPDDITERLISIGLFDPGTDPFGDSEQFLRIAIFGSIVFSVMAIGLSTLAAVMYNLISDVVGGIEFVVLEESLTSQSAGARPAYAPPPTVSAGSGNGPSGGTSVDLPTEETPVVGSR